MAIMNVNPTRMQLSELKKKLISLKRGHKILKDKRDELMRQFLLLVKENKELRLKVQKAISEANYHMALAGGVMSKEEIDIALMMPTQKVSLDVKKKTLMSIDVPSFELQLKSGDMSDVYSYGFAFTSSELDSSVKSLTDVLPDMLRLAEVEKTCQLLASEIERTRRRVNALEHVLIPDHEDTIRYITMKLDENERSTTTRLMKVKDMVLQKSHSYV
ncbi:MAG: V-type ATP synthase subunit D [Clostridia bacterium]|nr:V-type ATP synthase subunit D [Clostridia bacterium]